MRILQVDLLDFTGCTPVYTDVHPCGAVSSRVQPCTPMNPVQPGVRHTETFCPSDYAIV